MCIAKSYLQGAKTDFKCLGKCTSNKELWISYLREANIKVPFEDSNPTRNDGTYGLQHGSGGPLTKCVYRGRPVCPCCPFDKFVSRCREPTGD